MYWVMLFENENIWGKFYLLFLLRLNHSEMFNETFLESLTLAISDFQDLDGVETKKADTHNMSEVLPVLFSEEWVWPEV